MSSHPSGVDRSAVVDVEGPLRVRTAGRDPTDCDGPRIRPSPDGRGSLACERRRPRASDGRARVPPVGDGGLIVITANSFIDGVEGRPLPGSHRRHGSSRRYRLAVITMSHDPTGDRSAEPIGGPLRRRRPGVLFGGVDRGSPSAASTGGADRRLAALSASSRSQYFASAPVVSYIRSMIASRSRVQLAIAAGLVGYSS